MGNKKKTMSASIAAFNNSGTQGLKACSTLDGEVECSSVFWNEQDVSKQTLYGCAISEISPNSGSAGYGSTQTFTVNNDVDILGDIYATINFTNTIKYDVAATHTAYGQKAIPVAAFKRYGLLNLISRVEFIVGSQTWQTLENKDILAVLKTEMDSGEWNQLTAAAEGNHTTDGIRAVRDWERCIFAEVGCKCTLKLPLLTKSLMSKMIKNNFHAVNGHMCAVANNQTVRIKLHFASADQVFSLGSATATDFSSTPKNSDFTFTVDMTGKQYIMVNAERAAVQNMDMHKVVHSTQNVSHQLEFVKDKASSAIDCDNFSLCASHLLVSIDNLDTTFHGSSDGTTDNLGSSAVSIINPKATIDAGSANLAVYDTVSADGLQGRYALGSITSCEVYLNSTSHTGTPLTGPLLGHIAPASLGLYAPEENIGPNNRHPAGVAFAVFPLADIAYSYGSSVPLNRFDGIRVKLVTNASTKSGKTSTVNVTCVGSTTVLYQNSAAALTQY